MIAVVEVVTAITAVSIKVLQKDVVAWLCNIRLKLRYLIRESTSTREETDRRLDVLPENRLQPEKRQTGDWVFYRRIDFNPRRDRQETGCFTGESTSTREETDRRLGVLPACLTKIDMGWGFYLNLIEMRFELFDLCCSCHLLCIGRVGFVRIMFTNRFRVDIREFAMEPAGFDPRLQTWKAVQYACSPTLLGGVSRLPIAASYEEDSRAKTDIRTRLRSYICAKYQISIVIPSEVVAGDATGVPTLKFTEHLRDFSGHVTPEYSLFLSILYT
ncbi:hypothetical protein RRG08_058041 [Elysia crispata]|uniref:Uncharacterized protein n=1 Tax=Elysia crispata TaxID=231223 RepID=A0AAE1AA86_9GAST|nr:hypothetical protein RRG08_058041 [Elysia crispata]